MRHIIKEELNYVKYLFEYQRGRVISEQKNVILEEKKTPKKEILPETIVPCPTDKSELSNYIQVDSIDSKEAKYYLNNVKFSNERQEINKIYDYIKSYGLKLTPYDRNHYITKIPNLKENLIGVFEMKYKKDVSGNYIFLLTDGSYKLAPFFDQSYLKTLLKNGDPFIIAIYYSIKPVCLKKSNQSFEPVTTTIPTTTTTTTIKPQPVVSTTPEPSNTIDYPEYNPPLVKKSFGYDPKGKIFNPFDDKHHYGGFYPKYTKKMKEIEKYYYGYDDEDGNHIDGEIEKAKKQNRRINFLKPFSKDDILSQQTYNNEFDQYLQTKNQAYVK